MSLKQKTINGLSWTFLDKFSNQIVQFIIGIILARLLTPQEYGLTGMVAIFLALSNVFITSGFGEALVRKKNATNEDYSTILIFNVIVGLICYLLLCFFSGKISLFFNEPALKSIIIVMSFTIIINSIGLVPRAYLWKKMDFKSLMKISMISTLISGVVGIVLAYYGFGVWSLVWRSIVASMVGTILLHFISTLQIKLKFSSYSFRELFAFSSKILVSEIINQVYINIYSLVIAKFFNARELGLYSRADNYKNLPSKTLNNIVQSVSYPVISEIRENNEKLKVAYRRLIKSTMLITFLLMIGMAATADNLILGLIGEKWRDTITYLQMLCFVGMFYPLHSLNINMLNVTGHSGLFLKIEIIKKALAIPTIIIGIFFGIKMMIMGMFINSLIGYYLNSYYSGKIIGYPMLEQIKDILPSFLLAISVGIILYTLGTIIYIPSLLLLFIQIIIGGALSISICELFKMNDYLYLKEIVLRNFKKK